MRTIESSQSSTGVRGTVPPKCGVRHGVVTVSRHATPTPDPGSAGVCHDRATAATVLSSTGGGFGRRLGASGCLLEGFGRGDPGADQSHVTAHQKSQASLSIEDRMHEDNTAQPTVTQHLSIQTCALRNTSRRQNRQTSTQQWVSGGQKWRRLAPDPRGLRPGPLLPISHRRRPMRQLVVREL